MKFTLSWLKDYLETDAKLDEIATQLTSLGLEVEEVTDASATLSAFTVAEITGAEKHPDADRLKVCKVNNGTETLNIVCGAPNARPGIKVVLARAGDYIPGLDVTLKNSKIRGVASEGMMCSVRELGLGDDHAGIMELPNDAVVGEKALPWLGGSDPMIEIGLTPDRADCAGVFGIARDLAAAGMGTLKTPENITVKSVFDCPVKVETNNTVACPFLMGRVIKGVKNGESPQWLKDRLTAIGLRPISALVDVTNYFSFTFARPLHVFDLNSISGNIVQARNAKAGEKLHALDEKTYKLDESILAIADAEKAHAIAGVMGGEESGCTEETTDVFLEVAYFNPSSIAHAGRSLGIVSDARYRFERGVDPAFVPLATELATQMILDLCGGEASTVVQAGEIPQTNHVIDYTPSYAEKLGGLAVEEAKQKEILQALGFTVAEKGPVWQVGVPSWRVDMDGAADVVEEILRVVGFDAIKPTPVRDAGAAMSPAVTEPQRRASLVRRILAGGRGLNEAVTWSFMDSAHVPLFAALPDGLKITNPIASNLNAMRPTPLATLIAAAGRNMDKGVADNAIFEVGPAFKNPTPTGEERVVAGVRTGVATPPNWAEKTRKTDVFDAKADAEAVLDALGVDVTKIMVTADAGVAYHPGRSGVFRLGKNVLAQFGEIHPMVLKKMGIKGRAVGFEVMLDNIPVAKKRVVARPLQKISNLQPVSRDFAFVVQAAVPAGELIKVARGVDERICSTAIFDVYQGAGIPAGHKSIALSVNIQPQETSLTNEEIEAISQKIIKAAGEKTGATLRE